MNIAELKRTRDQLVAKRDAYSSAIMAFNEVLRLEKDLPGYQAQEETPKRTRAPRGHFEEVLLKVLAKGPMTNPEIRAALTKDEYPYAATPENVRFYLVKLREQKKVVAKGEGLDMKYSLAK